jgi:hypothetical protein
MNKQKTLLLPAIALFAVHAYAQVGIGTEKPDSSSILDISSVDKGVLIPRVTLKSTTFDLDGQPGQPAGLLVYNIGGILSEGFYFWNGSEWQNLDSSTAVSPTISSLECKRADIEPQSFEANVPYVGLMRIPYEGGNGGRYPAGAPIQATAGNTTMQARLRPGYLEYGTGELVYEVTGTPTQNSPVGASFPINFGGKTCTATVGNIVSATVTSIASVGALYYTAEHSKKGYHRVVNTIDGKFSIRVFVPEKSELRHANIQIRSNMKPITIMWNGHISSQGGNTGTASNQFHLPAAGIWYGNTDANSDKAQSVADETNTGWGKRSVYENRTPEQRQYIWTTTDVNDKTVYVLTFMMGTSSNQMSVNANNMSKTKAFLQIEQIHAD